jgi:serine/threonine protein kinase
MVEVEDILEDAEFIYLVMKFGGEELYDVIARDGRFTEARAKHIIHQLLTALAAAADLGVAHHDVSIENVLLDAARPTAAGAGGESAALIDWGQCVKAPRDPTTGAAVPLRNSERWPGGYGKLNNQAPEVSDFFRASRPPTVDVFKLDSFAVGVMMFTMLFNAPPWNFNHDPQHAHETFLYITRGGLSKLLDAWGWSASPEAIQLLQALLGEDPAKRPGCDEALAFSWFHGL